MSTVQGDDRVEGEEPSEASPPNQQQQPRARGGRGAGRSEGSSSGSRRRGRAAAQAVEEPPSPEENGASAAADGVELANPSLRALYFSEVVPTMMREFEYDNIMQVPRQKKVMLNIGLGEALTNPRAIESATRDLTAISGQKPIVTRARKSIAGFKLREGNTIGVCVTLRGARMYHFVDRLFNTALPRIRDFRGVSPRSFDGRGNYSMGIREQIIFPEIDYGQIERIRGFQVTIATTARTDAEAERLLTLLGMPFARAPLS